MKKLTGSFFLILAGLALNSHFSKPLVAETSIPQPKAGGYWVDSLPDVNHPSINAEAWRETEKPG